MPKEETTTIYKPWLTSMQLGMLLDLVKEELDRFPNSPLLQKVSKELKDCYVSPNEYKTEDIQHLYSDE
jgi:hypothetical protein